MEIDADQLNTKISLKKVGMKMLAGLTWFTVGTSGGLFCAWSWIFGLHKNWGNRVYMTVVRTLLCEVNVWSLRLDCLRSLLLQSFLIPKVLTTVVCSRTQFKTEFVKIMQRH
jgi:hypothetical protein